MNDIRPNIDINKFINEIYPKKCPEYTYKPAIFPAVRRIIVLGDIHGDYELTIEMLKIAKVAEIIGTNIIWTGGDTYVVQVGDQVDRCRPIGNMMCNNPQTTQNDEASDILILKLFANLHLQAEKVGGAVISLLGNHEILNVTGQLTYVSYAGIKEFDNYVDPKNPSIKFKNGEEARAYAFAPGNEIGTFLGCSRYPAVIIGSHIFVHAGIVDGLISEIDLKGIEDFEQINVAIRLWLLGILKTKYIKNIINGSKNSMFWTRILGYIPPDVKMSDPICMNNISKVLKMMNPSVSKAKYGMFIGNTNEIKSVKTQTHEVKKMKGGDMKMIIAHTPMSFTHNQDICSTCSGKIWRVDNGSSSAFDKFDHDYMMKGKVSHNRRPQILEILNDNEYYICDHLQCKKSVF